MSLLLENAMVLDGVSNTIYKSSIMVDKDRIVKLNPPNDSSIDMRIDAEGMYVTPGFIDTHSHSDALIASGEPAKPKIFQGITTEVLGQDGISVAPVPLEYKQSWEKHIAGLEGEFGLSSFKTVKDYLQHLKQIGIYQNIQYLIPHGNIRMSVMGLDNIKANQEHIERMQSILKSLLQEGAPGMSTGLIYSPCVYSDTNELISLCDVLNRFDRPLVVHQRSEADLILESLDELICIARQTGVKIHLSHIKIAGIKNQGLLNSLCKKLDYAKQEGISITCDQYPYTAGSTMLGIILPPWVHEGGTDKMIERLKDNSCRKRIKDDINRGIKGWDNFIDFAGVENIFITSVKTINNQDIIGMNLQQIGKIKSKDPLDATFDLLIEEENAIGMYDYFGNEEVLCKLMNREEQNFCTDGLLGGVPHPRVYGTYPRVIRKYVKEKKVLSLIDAVKKMTSKPAKAFGIKDRGIIKEGYYADLVVFDYDKINDKATFQNPVAYPEGIELVMVNGSVLLKKDRFYQHTAGKVL